MLSKKDIAFMAAAVISSTVLGLASWGVLIWLGVTILKRMGVL